MANKQAVLMCIVKFLVLHLLWVAVLFIAVIGGGLWIVHQFETPKDKICQLYVTAWVIGVVVIWLFAPTFYRKLKQ